MGRRRQEKCPKSEQKRAQLLKKQANSQQTGKWCGLQRGVFQQPARHPFAVSINFDSKS